MKKKKLINLFKKVNAYALSVMMAMSAFAGLSLATAPKTVSAEAAIDYELPDNIQDGVILHCWNWSYNNIKKYLPQIAAAGYTAVQTSPVTQPKDYYWEGVAYGNVGIPDGVGGYDGNWWKVYQPVTESICDNGNIWFGTKAEFKAMCDEAEKYGIKVIVDIVANHMGNIKGWKIGSVEEVMGDISPQVGEFWNPDMLTDSSYWHISTSWVHSSDGRFDVTQGNMGMPDLNTGDKKVQTMILNLLKECIDNGADGFRFDAAKHIETPADDASIASDFWDVVLDGATSYAQNTKGFTPYYYGEVLNRIDSTAAEKYYISKMSLTDNATSDNVRNSLKYGGISSASNPGYCGYVHGRGDRVVLWAESHDTYMGGGSSYDCNDSTINKAWAVIASRKDSTALYFARPYYSYERLIDDQNGYDARKDPAEMAKEIRQTQLGEVGTLTWMDTCVAEVNRFRNHFVGQSESLGNVNDKIFYNVRGDSGVVIVNTEGAGDVSISLGSKMKDGTYTDQVTGNKFTVSGGKISGTIGNEDGIAVVYNTTSVPRSTIEAPRENFATDSIDITVGLANAKSGTYSINGSAAVTYTKDTTFTIGAGDAIGTKYNVVLTATDGTNTTTGTYTFKKESKNVNPVSIVCSKRDGAKFCTDGITVTIEAANADTASYKVSTDNKEIPLTEKTEITIGKGLNIGDTVTLTVSGSNDKGEVTKEFTFIKASEDEVEDTIVYFKNSVGWSNIHAYAWRTVDGESVKNAEWPGQAMECIDSENKIYALDLGETFEKIVFNNGGSGSQSENLTFTPGCIYDDNTGKWTEYNVIVPTDLTVTAQTSSSNVTVGSNVTITAAAQGGSGSYTYKFMVFNKDTNSWYTFGDFASSNKITWKASSAGNRSFYVEVKDGSGKVVRSSAVNVTVSNSTALSVTGKASASNVTVGSSVTVTATAAGGSGSYTYSFLVWNTDTGEWHRFNNTFNSSNTITWKSGSAGNRKFYVEVKDGTGKVVRSSAINVTVSGSNKLSVTGKASGSSVTVGNSVTITATAAGGSGSYKYSFLVWNTDTDEWYRFNKTFTSSNTLTWKSSGKGNRKFYVEVKDGTGKVVRSSAISVFVK